MTSQPSSSLSAIRNSTAPLTFAFDVGHSSIGWAVLAATSNGLPDILGCGVVTFEKDSALAIQRRQHRQQRRHIRATRQRIARIEKLLAHVGCLDAATLSKKHTAGAGHPTPWLLAARVLRSDGQHILSWPELWDVLRWYAHNRGYEPIGTDADEKENEEKRANAREAMERFGTRTMAETVCSWLGQEPMAARTGSVASYKARSAAFDRDIVVAEVGRILNLHIGRLAGLDTALVSALLDNAQALPCPAIRLPRRFHGGLLFGRLATRYHNRIIGRCPISGAKRPSNDCPEYYRFRWGMLLANIVVQAPADTHLRPLLADERRALTRLAEQEGSFTPAAFRKAVRDLTARSRDNLDQMFMDATAEENLVLDPALRLARRNRILARIWPQVPESVQRHVLNRWRRGRSQTLSAIRAEAAATGADLTEFDRAIAAAASQPVGRNSKKAQQTPQTVEMILVTKFLVPRLGGRAPYARPLLAQAYHESLAGKHPLADGCLLETANSRQSRENRSISEQTNNHLVRHRLQILGRLVTQLVEDPAYACGTPSRVEQLVIEVNRDLREMAGLTAKQIATEMNDRLRSHARVSKRLVEELPPEVQINASLIRKARIADDLGWRCPYTGQEFEPGDLVHGRVDQDHIIPRSQRASDSLDSLVITYSAINLWKGKRTAWQFVKDEETKPVPGMPHLTIKQLARYEADVRALDRRGHRDDQRRKERRIANLLLARYEENGGGFTPGQLTQTSQLARLGQQVLRAPFTHLPAGPRFVAIPGPITSRVRAAWGLLGCLADAVPDVLASIQNGDDGGGHKTLKTKTEIREITHLHHAVDACVLGLASMLLPNRGDVWRLLLERRVDPAQRLQLEALNVGAFDANGGYRLNDLPNTLKNQVGRCLSERRVVQHVPAEMSGIRLEENTRGITARNGDRVCLRQRRRNTDGSSEVSYTEKYENRVIGLTAGSKLAEVKGVRVIVDNFGVAIRNDDTLAQHERAEVIPFAQVWRQLEDLKSRNVGRRPEVWRNGQVLEVPSGAHAGRWRIFSVMNSKGGPALKLDRVDAVNYADNKGCSGWKTSVATLLKAGARRVRENLAGSA